ncbi:MAG TPA: TIR domain-containing protein [Chloroflexota bacterium]|nr:TIR domain-containing protein [Chloroflexota bacterium]
MAAIQPTQARAASVVAREKSVVGKLTDAQLAEIAGQQPAIYRAIAQELARRLEQRNRFVVAPRDTTRVFIMCSVEALPVARTVQNALQHDPFTVTVWTDGTFRVANYPVEDLEAQVDQSDFAIAIAHADDVVDIREQTWPVPRDNVTFELGLFMGRLGRKRAILMEPRDEKIKLPSDLAGLTTIPYRYEPGGDAAALMAPACNRLRDHINELGPSS